MIVWKGYGAGAVGDDDDDSGEDDDDQPFVYSFLKYLIDKISENYDDDNSEADDDDQQKNKLNKATRSWWPGNKCSDFWGQRQIMFRPLCTSLNNWSFWWATPHCRG